MLSAQARTTLSGLMLFLLVVAGGCTVNPPPKDGFLSSYKNLKDVGNDKMRYVSPKLADYSSFIVDPVVINAKASNDKN